VLAVVIITAVCAGLSARWPVEYASAGVISSPPVSSSAPAAASDIWSGIAHPAYVGFQVLWVVAVLARWRTSDGHVRQQLAWLVAAAAVSVVALVVGLAGWGTPRAGLLTATLVPVAAGWAIVHGQHLAAYSALSWLSRTGTHSGDLPDDLARAVAQALLATGATLWVGADELHAIGVWPVSDQEIEPTTLKALEVSADRQIRPVSSRGNLVGAISVDRAQTERLSLAEHRLFDDLAFQASLVIDHISLADVIARQQQAGHLNTLTPREREVLALTALGRAHQGLSPGPARTRRVEFEYERGGTLAYFAAYDVHRAQVMGQIAPTTGIVPFTDLVAEVMSTQPYASARRVFWVVDNDSSRDGKPSIVRMQGWPTATLVHLPVHASRLNQVEIYFSILQRKAINPPTSRILRPSQQPGS